MREYVIIRTYYDNPLMVHPVSVPDVVGLIVSLPKYVVTTRFQVPMDRDLKPDKNITIGPRIRWESITSDLSASASVSSAA